MTTAVVVGAGAGGLVAAWELIRAGYQVTVCEAGRRPGGLLARTELAGLALDAGAEGFSVRGGAVERLLIDLGAAADIVQPNSAGAWLHTAAGAHPIPARLVFGMPADPDAADVRAVVGAVPEPPAQATGSPGLSIGPADAATGPGGSAHDERSTRSSFADLVRSNYGERVLSDLVSPLVGGVYSTVPELVTLTDLAPALADAIAAGTPLRTAVARAASAAPPGGAVQGLNGGMHRLVGRLIAAAQQDGRFELCCAEPASRLRRLPGRWVVATPHREITAELLVLAAPIDVVVALLGPVLDPRTGQWTARARPMPAGPDLVSARAAPGAPERPVVRPTASANPRPTRIDVLTAVFDAPGLAGEAPRGTGVLVGRGVAGVAAKALTHSTAKWSWLREMADGREVFRLSYGRLGQPPATAGLDHVELCEIVRSDVSALLGRRLPKPVAVQRDSWSILPPGTPGLAAAREWLTGLRLDDLGLVGAGVAGVGLASVVAQARAEVARLIHTGWTNSATRLQGSADD